MKNKQKLFILFIYFIIFIFLLNNFFSLSLFLDRYNYFFLLFSYILCGASFMFTICRKNYYIFEPYTLVSLLYLSIMIIRPCLDIINENYYRFGIYVMDGCAKGTIIFTISFLVFTFSYNFIFIRNKKDNMTINNKFSAKSIKLFDYRVCYTKKVRTTCIILFILGVFFTLLYYKTSGYSVSLFFRNIDQGDNIYLNNSNFKFLSKMGFLMIIPWIYISRFDQSLFLKIITTLLMFTFFIIGGARYIIVVTLLAYIILPYVSEKKNFSFKKAIILFILLLLFCDILAFARYGIRNGKKIDFKQITNYVEITDVFDSDLTIYQPFYCVVDRVPDVIPHQMGKGLIGYSIVSFLPRVLFPIKSKFDIMANVIGSVMNDTAMKAGLAMPNIGEFYLEFGFIGCIICMFIFGIICRNLKKLYLNNNYGVNELVLYCVLFPFLMQIVCRGYLAVQLNSLLFITLPYFVLKILFDFDNKCEVS